MFRLKTILPILGMLLLAVTAGASDRLLNSLNPKNGVAVYDYANVISASDKRQLESMIDELEQKTGAEIAVVTLQSLDGGQIDDFTNRLFEKWGVGQKGKDNGLMFLAAMQDRKMRIEVGYGLEGAIPDSKAGRIRRDVITPYFKANQPGKGITAGIAVLSQEIAKEYGVQLTGSAMQYRYPANARSRGSEPKEVHPLLLLLFGVGFVIFAIRHPHLAMLLLLSGGGGRGGGGGGFGGGGGGFGGGMSGGGGSSGGW
ncbi:TPM domain-containing protein [Pontiellaceae bacterium B12219]|nr:TPM domain-containing protein [Pontiellaceae bacterium B12219]